MVSSPAHTASAGCALGRPGEAGRPLRQVSTLPHRGLLRWNPLLVSPQGQAVECPCVFGMAAGRFCRRLYLHDSKRTDTCKFYTEKSVFPWNFHFLPAVLRKALREPEIFPHAALHFPAAFFSEKVLNSFGFPDLFEYFSRLQFWPAVSEKTPLSENRGAFRKFPGLSCKYKTPFLL